MCRLLCTLILLASGLMAGAAPMTLKEIDFLLRQRTSEAEITAQLNERRLLMVPDAAAAEILKRNGATPAFLSSLPQFVLPPAEAQAYIARVSQARGGAPEAAPAAAQPAGTPKAGAPAAPLNRHWVVEKLAGKLVHLDGDEVKSFDTQRLRDVRVFAFYNSAMWCGPCRKFTPQLVTHYKQLKAQYPNVEVIFLSQDRDEFNMANYMRTHKMPWPAVKFGSQRELQQLFCGDSIPWLVCVAADGRPLTKNGADKQYIEPAEVMGALDYLAAQLK